MVADFGKNFFSGDIHEEKDRERERERETERDRDTDFHLLQQFI